jgi:hypothetical protein
MAIVEKKKIKNIKFKCSVHGPLELSDVIVYDYTTTDSEGKVTPWLARICLKCLNEVFIALGEKGSVGKVSYEIEEENENGNS